MVLFQVNVQDKQHEISALKPRLSPAFIKGRIFPLDAMPTQTDLCAKVDRLGGWYVLLAKDHQPTLATDLADFFASPPPDWQWTQAETWDKAHGRLEHRHILCSPEVNDWFARRWAGIAQVFRLQRTTPCSKWAQCASKRSMASAIFRCPRPLPSACLCSAEGIEASRIASIGGAMRPLGKIAVKAGPVRLLGC